MSYVRIGDAVCYYPNMVTTVPMLGLVTEVYTQDMVSLTVWEANRWMGKQSVHRQGCKQLRENPTIGYKTGSWDFRAEKLPDLIPQTPSERPKKS